MGIRSSNMEYTQSKSANMSICHELQEYDVSCLSAHYQNNISCQDMTATVLSSDEEWLRFKQAMKKTPARTNAAVLQYMQAELRMKSRAERQHRQKKRNRSKPEVPGEICGADGTPSYKRSNENIAEMARTQSEDEDERQWYHRGSIVDMLSGDLRHPVILPCTTPGRYSSKKNPEKPGELICEFGPRRFRITTRPWPLSRSPSPPKPSRRESTTSVSSLDAAVRSVLSIFDDDSNSKGELLEDFGTRASQKRPSFALSKSVWYNPIPGSSESDNDEAVICPILTLQNSRAA